MVIAPGVEFLPQVEHVAVLLYNLCVSVCGPSCGLRCQSIIAVARSFLLHLLATVLAWEQFLSVVTTYFLLRTLSLTTDFALGYC